MLKRKPHHKGFKQRTKPMKQIGKAGRANQKANRINKARFEKAGVEYCQVCGRTGALSNSHSQNRDLKPELTRTALLCIWPCHQFIELELTHEQREAVNEFIIESDLDQEYMVEEMMKLIPKDKADEWKRRLNGEDDRAAEAAPLFQNEA